MNCSEARALLAIYQELQADQEEVVALKEHLSTCEACKQAHMQYQRIGVQIRSLPEIETSPDAHTKLMRALALEHVHFIQRTHSSTVSTPTPAFLVPYLKDLSKHAPHVNNLIAFSTADTGPLPPLKSLKRRPTHQMRHFAIIGAAASILMILMISGLTSLLLLSSSRGHNIPSNAAIVNPVPDVQSANFPTTATYPFIASATVNGNSIFYTSYSSQAASWDLQQVDKNTRASMSLLSHPSTDELFILESSAQWLVWLQISPPATQNSTSSPQAQASATATPTSGEQKSNTTNPDRQWSLSASYLGTPLTQPLDKQTTTTIIPTQVFHPNTVPNWVNTPVQGVWLNDNQLLVAMIDDKGVSHLSSYQLEQGKQPQPIDITTTAGAETETSSTPTATTQKHILTSPTASSDNQNIYWDEEWLTDQGELKGDIWTFQKVSTTAGQNGTPPAVPTPHPFQSDGMSFHPQMVANNLFFVSKNTLNNNTTITNVTPTVTTTPDPTATISSTVPSNPTATLTPSPTATPTPINPRDLLGGSVKIDPNVLTPQIDETIKGRIRAFAADGTPEELPQLDSNRIVSALQGGSRYLIWQNSENSFEMYDVMGKYPVNVGSGTISRNAAFVYVNENTGIWVENSNNATSNSTNVTFNLFTWPWPRENTRK